MITIAVPLLRSIPLFVLAAWITGCGATSSAAAPSAGSQPASAPREDRSSHRAQADRQPAAPSVEARSAGVELRHERSDSSWLGVELRATAPDRAGVEIVRVIPGSPAESALLAGDVLTTLGEELMGSPREVSDYVRAQPPGSTLPVGILRQGKPRLVRVHLEGMPDFEDRLRLAFVGKKAPEISGVITFQGEAASLRELRGQVVILEFWASFCQICRVMAPQLDQWQRRFAPQGAQVIGITVDDPESGLAAARKAKMSYALASDPEAKVTRRYLASQIPLLVVIDKRGVVRDAVVGYSQERLVETEDLIRELLKESA